jgi:arylsulfatase A-like enzyme
VPPYYAKTDFTGMWPSEISSRRRKNEDMQRCAARATSQGERPGRPLLGFVLILAAAVVAGFLWRQALTGERGGGRPAWNVLILTLDTTRADRLGPYGFAGADTPNIDRLASEGVLFEQAESAAPLTLPAHTSLFTGRFPFQHGVRDNGAVLDPAERTLAQVLQARGLRTAAFAASYVLDARWGLARGFDVYDGTFDPRRGDAARHLDDVRRPADEVVDHALAWLETVSGSPFFGWLHFYDAHTPYESSNARAIRNPGYQGAIAFIDSQIGRVLAFLDAHHLREHTVVVLVGDHGESLGEHGERTHGLFVYEGVMRVPLIIAAPSPHMRGRRVTDVVRSVDVMPTVLDLLGLRVPSSVAGSTLATRMTGATDEPELETYSETMYPRYHFGWSELRAVRAGGFKLIAAPRPELYDLDTDPGEEHDLYQSRPALAATLAGRLRVREHQVQARAASERAIDPDALARLSALGYVGAPSVGRPMTELPDPKDNIGLYQLITGDRQWLTPRGADDVRLRSSRP